MENRGEKIKKYIFFFIEYGIKIFFEIESDNNFNDNTTYFFDNYNKMLWV